MGSFQRLYTDQQRDVIVRAVLDQGMTAPRACTAAAEGKLGVPAFSMKLGSAQHYVRGAKQRRHMDSLPDVARQGTAAAVQEYTARLLTVADRITTELVRQGVKAPPEQAIKAARLVHELAKLDPHNKNASTTGPKGKTPTPEPKAPTSFVSQLAAQLAETEPPSENTTQGETDTGEHATPPTPQHKPHDRA